MGHKTLKWREAVLKSFQPVGDASKQQLSGVRRWHFMDLPVKGSVWDQARQQKVNFWELIIFQTYK